MTPDPTPTPLLTVRDAAAMLCISERHLHRLTADGHVPHVRLGRLVRYDAARLAAWLVAQTRGGDV